MAYPIVANSKNGSEMIVNRLRGSRWSGKRTLARFEPLSLKERLLLENCRRGTNADVSEERPAVPASKNQVRAEFVRFLLMGADESTPIHVRGIKLEGAWISGSLDLTSAKVTLPAAFENCTFDAAPVFSNSQISAHVIFSSCKMPALLGERISCAGSFTLRDSTVDGDVSLVGARITGDLCFENSTGESISAANASVTGAVLCNGLCLSGNLNLMNATIQGELDLCDAHLTGHDELSLFAYGMKLGGDLLMHRIEASGLVLSRADLSGNLVGEEVTLLAAGGAALRGDAINVRHSMVLCKGAFEGHISLLSAKIGGALQLDGSKLKSPEDGVLSADRATIGGNVSLVDGFTAEGGIRMLGARVGKSLYLGSAHVTGKVRALQCDGIDIAGDLCIDDGFTSVGEVRLSGAVIGGDLTFEDSSLRNEDGYVIWAENLRVDGALILRRMKHAIDCICLTSSRVGKIVDDENSWGQQLILDGLIYGGFTGGAPTTADARLRWIDKQLASHAGRSESNDFKPQPWHQLRRVLREMGHFEDARQVAIAYERRMYAAGLIGQSPEDWPKAVGWINRVVSRTVHRAFGLLIGYGYRPGWLIAWGAAVWLVCGAVYWSAANDGIMAPSNPLVFHHPDYSSCRTGEVSNKGNWYLCPALPEEYTGFSPLAYSLDVLLPLVDLQQQQDWAPKIPTPVRPWYSELTVFSPEHCVRLVLWFEVIFGWVASLLLVAVISGLTKRAED